MKTKHLIRDSFRKSVFSRDRHQCKKCGSRETLDAHHITDRHEMPNGGYVSENGISLCPRCHLEAENFHRGLVVKEGFTPSELYAAINSSKELAHRKSSLL